MSRFEKLFAGFGFRTPTPTFEVGEEISAFVTGRDDDGLRVRIGDTVLKLPDADPGLLDGKVRLEIESFDDELHFGTARVVDVLENEG
ncbi:DUF7513 family protein [Halobellus sp. GM3]|uniref:DUF7513 family protein n=1 Tax=Halobellus sp. GM3 TaxID=3458410 RepID=UPI00403DA3BD